MPEYLASIAVSPRCPASTSLSLSLPTLDCRISTYISPSSSSGASGIKEVAKAESQVLPGLWRSSPVASLRLSRARTRAQISALRGTFSFNYPRRRRAVKNRRDASFYFTDELGLGSCLARASIFLINSPPFHVY